MPEAVASPGGAPVAIGAIRGTTLLAGTIADPVAHVQAPETMGNWFATRGIEAVWLPFHVGPDGLARFVDGLRTLRNLAGFTVTMPHKHAIIPLLDAVSDRVRRSGVANMVRREADGRLIGDIADGIGFVAGLRASDVTITGRSIWLVGAGGAGTAIAWALAEEKPAALTVFDIDAARRDRLVRDIAAAFPAIVVATGRPDLCSVDIAVNATPIGLRTDDPLPFDPSALRPDACVIDIIMKPAITALLQRASELGMKTVPGQRMLDGQIAIYAEYLGLLPPLSSGCSLVA